MVSPSDMLRVFDGVDVVVAPVAGEPIADKLVAAGDAAAMVRTGAAALQLDALVWTLLLWHNVSSCLLSRG